MSRHYINKFLRWHFINVEMGEEAEMGPNNINKSVEIRKMDSRVHTEFNLAKYNDV